MADRVFRDEIMSSPRYWALPSDTHRMLFFHLGLCADDMGIFRAANYTIRQECFGADTKPTPEVLAKLLADLADADLIRLYRTEDGREFGFIPRWKQRLRIVRVRFPLPPPELRDNAIRELIEKLSGTCQPDVGHMSPEIQRIRNSTKLSRKESATAPVDNSSSSGPQSWTQHWKAQGKAFGIEPLKGEKDGDYCRRVIAYARDHPTK